jgi:hypothetical protein
MLVWFVVGNDIDRVLKIAFMVVVCDTVLNVIHFRRQSRDESLMVCLLASLIRQCQELVRFGMHLWRGSLTNLCHRMDFFVGQESRLVKSDQTGHLFRFGLFVVVVVCAAFLD